MGLFLEVVIYAVNILLQYIAAIWQTLLSGGIASILLFALGSAWIFYCIKKDKADKLLAPFIVFNLGCAITWGIFAGIAHDEAEHLHCVWMVSKGLVPYRDFWQHHLPMMWAFLSIPFRWIKPTAYIFLVSRLFCALLFACTAAVAWMIAKKVWGNRAYLPIFILVILSDNFFSNFIELRPLCFMIFFILLGIYFCMRIPEDKLRWPLLAGAAISFGLTFDFREVIFITLPAIFILLEDRRWILRRLSVCIAGMIIGSLPFLFYITKNHIVADLFYWAIALNFYKAKLSLGPILVRVAAGLTAGWFLVRAIYYKAKGSKASVVLWVAILYSMLFSLTLVYIQRYFLTLCFILFAIFLSGFSGSDMLRIIKLDNIKKSIAIGLIMTIALIPGVQTIRSPRLFKDTAIISKLLKISANQQCITLAPYHPIFAYDAIGIYTTWQFLFLQGGTRSTKFVASKNVTNQVIDLKPAVIAYGAGERELFELIKYLKIVTDEEYDKIESFLKEEYSVKDLGGERFYIRNDLLKEAGL